MIEEYGVYYKDILIAKFNLNIATNHCDYLPIEESKMKIDGVIISGFFNEYHGEIHNLSVIWCRVRDMKKIKNLNECKYINNSYWIKRIKITD